MGKILKKVVVFAASTILTSGITSLGTAAVNKMQTEENVTFQEKLNQQFVENDKKIIELLDKIEQRLKKLEK